MTPTTSAIDEALQRYRQEVNAELARLMSPESGLPDRLLESMSYSLLAGGKRLRPILVLLACECCGGERSRALLECSLSLGTRIARGTEEQRLALTHYGRCLGLAFQITDDLLDVRGTQVATGKGVGKDAARGKQTYPSLMGVEASQMRAELLVAEAVDSLAMFGERARPLETLARFVLDRDH